jgi:hypothetical protein
LNNIRIHESFKTIHQRIERGEQGAPENDCYEAENYLRETVV